MVVTVNGRPGENPCYTNTTKCEFDYFLYENLDLVSTAMHVKIQLMKT